MNLVSVIWGGGGGEGGVLGESAQRCPCLPCFGLIGAIAKVFDNEKVTLAYHPPLSPHQAADAAALAFPARLARSVGNDPDD